MAAERRFERTRQAMVTMGLATLMSCLMSLQVFAENLPVFTEGPWKNLHAIYQTENYDAEIDAKGKLTVYPKEDGKRMDKPLQPFNFGLRYRYTYMWYPPEPKPGETKPKPKPKRKPRKKVVLALKPGQGRTHSGGGGGGPRKPHRRHGDINLKLQDCDFTPRNPATNPGSVTIDGRWENGGEVRVVYEFRSDEITYTLGFNPGRIEIEKDDVRFRHNRIGWSVAIPKSHDISPYTEQNIREQMMAGCVVLTTPANDAPQVAHNYAEVLFFDENPLVAANIIGPWGGRQISFIAEGMNFNGVRREKHNWRDHSWYCPFQGFKFHFGRTTKEPMRVGDWKVSLRIE